MRGIARFFDRRKVFDFGKLRRARLNYRRVSGITFSSPTIIIVSMRRDDFNKITAKYRR